MCVYLFPSGRACVRACVRSFVCSCETGVVTSLEGCADRGCLGKVTSVCVCVWYGWVWLSICGRVRCESVRWLRLVRMRASVRGEYVGYKWVGVRA